MSTDGPTTAIARGLAAFVGLFALINAITLLRRPGVDANLWWIDLRLLPASVNALLTLAIALALFSWSIAPRMSPPRRTAMTAMLVFAIGAAILNTITFYRLVFTRAISTPIPVPFSMLVILALATILMRSFHPPATSRPFTFALAFAAAAVAFPLAQIALFGQTDYRRPADAIVVFGARAYRDGTPSDALGDRILTAITLYQQGLAPRIILSGGAGDGAISEAHAMRRVALSAGIPDDALIIDDAGLNTDATVANTRRILGDNARVLAVSHNWHLPRVKLRFDREGLRAYTIPADTRGQPLRNTPYLILREVPAIWVYWLRGAM